VEQHITVYIHLGDWMMPKNVAAVPELGDLVDAGILGHMRVTRIERDADDDVHLYLDSTQAG
jgi:hypothetical protein